MSDKFEAHVRTLFPVTSLTDYQLGNVKQHRLILPQLWRLEVIICITGLKSVHTGHSPSGDFIGKAVPFFFPGSSG